AGQRNARRAKAGAPIQEAVAPEISARRVSVVRVPIARVERGVADLRAEPRADAELVDQVRFGERLTLLAEQNDWHFVQAREDHYFGWIQDVKLLETDEMPGDGVVSVLLAITSAAPGGPESFRLPAGHGWSSATRAAASC